MVPPNTKLIQPTQKAARLKSPLPGRMMSEDQIRDRLVEHGEILFKAKHTFVDFTKNKAADRLRSRSAY
ncbi:MAG: hypothetical protein AVO39_09630 [delta proteobacterium MLS_D]|jgi:hypothetical protein|nr:MAG: hypothetical protein AVO39_09630 [delta proteobacterium MLS_D]